MTLIVSTRGSALWTAVGLAVFAALLVALYRDGGKIRR